jgi:hypothetical protein
MALSCLSQSPRTNTLIFLRDTPARSFRCRPDRATRRMSGFWSRRHRANRHLSIQVGRQPLFPARPLPRRRPCRQNGCRRRTLVEGFSQREVRLDSLGDIQTYLPSARPVTTQVANTAPSSSQRHVLRVKAACQRPTRPACATAPPDWRNRTATVAYRADRLPHRPRTPPRFDRGNATG